MRFKLWARIECDKCYDDEDWEMSFDEDAEDLMNQASACGWGIYNDKQLCPKCLENSN